MYTEMQLLGHQLVHLVSKVLVNLLHLLPKWLQKQLLNLLKNMVLNLSKLQLKVLVQVVNLLSVHLLLQVLK